MTSSKNYSWDAKDYAKNSQNQFQWAKELILKLNLKGNENLLDIGCGDGKITAKIAKCLPKGRAVGIDSSNQMIKLAKSIFLNRQYTNLTFELMDARKIAFESQFDIAFSNAALHWIVDQKAILLGVQRSLKTQGRILFQMAGKGNAQAILNILDDLLAMPQWESYFDDFTFPYAFLSPEMYRLMLLEAGLTPLRVELLPKEMKFAGAEGLAGWVRTTWLPFTERLPVERRDSFVGEIVNRYLEFHPVDATGVVHLDMIRLEAEAQKV